MKKGDGRAKTMPVQLIVARAMAAQVMAAHVTVVTADSDTFSGGCVMEDSRIVLISSSWRCRKHQAAGAGLLCTLL